MRSNQILIDRKGRCDRTCLQVLFEQRKTTHEEPHIQADSFQCEPGILVMYSPVNAGFPVSVLFEPIGPAGICGDVDFAASLKTQFPGYTVLRPDTLPSGGWCNAQRFGSGLERASVPASLDRISL